MEIWERSEAERIASAQQAWLLKLAATGKSPAAPAGSADED
jgi:hypothetical protein